MHACTETGWRADFQVVRIRYSCGRNLEGHWAKTIIRAPQREKKHDILGMLHERSRVMTTDELIEEAKAWLDKREKEHENRPD